MTGAEAQHEQDTSAGVRLLADLRAIFDTDNADALYTSTVLERLHKFEEALGRTGTAIRCAPASWPTCSSAIRSSLATSASTALASPARATAAPTCMTRNRQILVDRR